MLNNNPILVLTKESRCTPGSQTLEKWSDSYEDLAREIKRREEEDQQISGIKMYYVYKIHKVQPL